jgi:hypothetical protein
MVQRDCLKTFANLSVWSVSSVVDPQKSSQEKRNSPFSGTEYTEQAMSVQRDCLKTFAIFSVWSVSSVVDPQKSSQEKRNSPFSGAEDTERKSRRRFV